MTVSATADRGASEVVRTSTENRRPPTGAVLLGGLAALLVVLPMAGLLWRAPWRGLGSILREPDVGQAIWLSIGCSLSAAAISVALGTPIAWVLARFSFPGRALVRALVALPMVLPPVVGGVALLAAFGRNGVLGIWLDRWFGLTLPFTTVGVVLAETFVAMPFLVIAAEAGFRAADSRLEEAARSFGARPWTVFRRVTLPIAWPALAAGAVLSWARAIGEFGASITFAGNFAGRTQTIPLKVYLLLETDPQAAVALSLILLVISLAVLVGLRSRWLGTG